MKTWRGQPDSWNWKPSRLDKARLWLALAAVFYLMSFVATRSPANASGGGKLRWLENILSDAFSTRGDVLLYGVVGTVCLLAAIYYFRAPKS